MDFEGRFIMKKRYLGSLSFFLAMLFFCMTFSGISLAAAEKVVISRAKQESLAAEQAAKAAEEILPEDLPQNDENRKRVKELKDKNTEYATFYENEDGTESVDVSMSPIRFKDKSGKLVDIDTNLVDNDNKNKDQAFKVASASFNAYIDDDIEKDQAARIEHDKYAVSFQFLKENDTNIEDEKLEIAEKETENKAEIKKLKDIQKSKEATKKSKPAVEEAETQEELKKDVLSKPSKKVKNKKKKETEKVEADEENPLIVKNKKDKRKKYESVKYQDVLE